MENDKKIQALAQEMGKRMENLEEKLTKVAQPTSKKTDNARVDDQAREHTLQQMAKDLEAKFVFVMGSASKAKKLPHASTMRKPRGTTTQTEDTTTEQPKESTSPTPIDILDILQA